VHAFLKRINGQQFTGEERDLVGVVLVLVVGEKPPQRRDGKFGNPAPPGGDPFFERGVR